MNREAARLAHRAVNFTYWMEKPEWKSGSKSFDIFRKLFQAAPVSLHELLKNGIFDPAKVLAIGGESVVAIGGISTVDKFMFRYPGKMALSGFKVRVADEIRAVTSAMPEVTPNTTVSEKNAAIFRKPYIVPAVTQTQPRLNLQLHQPFNLSWLESDPKNLQEQTARDLELLCEGSSLLINMGYYPDISLISGNVRRNVNDGRVTLIDVMPFYADGRRLIGDKPPNVIPGILNHLEEFEEIAGRYGG